MKGHKRETCYKLVGYPSNHTNNKRRNFDRPQQFGNNHRGPLVNNANYVESSEAMGSNYIAHQMPMPVVTLEQYQQILQLINNSPSSSTSPRETNVNMAGISSCSSICLAAGTETTPWVIDTEATNHIVSSLYFL
ncbi:hypothetical protein A4A49_64172, partial [Nicotiana attenuata]